jgi:hypothetical protein
MTGSYHRGLVSAADDGLPPEVAFDDRADAGRRREERTTGSGPDDGEQAPLLVAYMHKHRFALAASRDAACDGAAIIERRTVIEMAGAFVIDDGFIIPDDIEEVVLHLAPLG